MKKEFVYKFKSNINVNVGDDMNTNLYQEDLVNFSKYEKDLSNELNESMIELGPKGLAEYYSGYLKNELKKIYVTVENCKAITYVETSESLTDDDIFEVMDYIKSQFSDGWGEGFEQVIFAECLDIEYDENDDEEIEIAYPLTASFYSKNMNLKLMI